ncbi:MAG: DEAD/DEAH box helicase family protein [Candidatus Poribacteria bacterium]|nr:DEAD/DEAH box helicase family protein [Candidatus Poribacteria bacterium]
MNQNRSDIPIQPVEQPILCSPYKKPNAHWFYEENGEVIRQEGRRDAGYWYKTQRTGSEQLQMFREEEWDDLPLVNALRADVERWRETNYRNATSVTRELLRHWARDDLLRRLFFCQREAVETIIYLAEIRQGGKRILGTPQFTDENLAALVDSPNEPDIRDLIRYGCKMATGSGKTVVMAMLIAWAFCNRGKVPSDERFPQAALVVCPNLTIKKRLQVLRPEDSDNYYDEFELIPHKLRPLLNSGKVMVTNWHQFAPESPHIEGGQTYAVVDKGDETPDAFAKHVLGELYDRAPIMVLNDEGHHAYRPAPTEEKLSADEKKETKIVYEQDVIFPELANGEGVTRTLRIDSKMLAAAESEDPNKNRSQVAENLRQIVATIGKRGQPGEQIRCVVSVAMLNEGWDANNVTHILGLRAFSSQLLCEQVVGRGLRRMNYAPDPETGLLTEEYVDVYGIPFSVIPFRGRTTGARAPDDKPKNHVRALPEREHLEIRFPVVEGYAFALQKDEIKADIASTEPLSIQPEINPTALYVKPAVGYETGAPSASGPGAVELQNREEYYQTTHLQAIKFGIAHRIVHKLVGDSQTAPAPDSNPKLRLLSRHRLFPQVFRFVDAYVRDKVDFRGCNPCELGQEKYVTRIVERLMTAIQPDETKGEIPLLPILNRYAPIVTSADVDFLTPRPCTETQRSHVNQVVLDTGTWERAAKFRLEQSEVVECYVRNDHLGLGIPYEHDGISHLYEPDFIVRLTNGVHLVLEIKGFEPDRVLAKHAAARRWVSAVNNWGKLKKWDFLVCRDPQLLGEELNKLVTATSADATRTPESAPISVSTDASRPAS